MNTRKNFKSVIATIASLFTLSTAVSASTQGIRGFNWADARDNYTTGWVIPSGLSATSTASQAASLAANVSRAAKSIGCTTIRLPVNPSTVASSFWPIYQSAINSLIANGLKVDLCYWTESHAVGTVSNTTTWNQMWASINSAYGSNSQVYFEPINEPHGYSATDLCNLYASFISTYHCPNWKCLLDGTGWADHVAPVGSDRRLANQYLAEHFYRWPGNGWYQDYYNQLASLIGGYESRTVIDEMGDVATDGAYYWMRWNSNLWGQIEYIDGACKYVYDHNMGSMDWSGICDGNSYRWWSSSTDIANGSYRLVNPSYTNMFRWSWHQLGPSAMNNGTFQVVPYVAQSMCLTANGYGTWNGTNVNIWSNTGQSNQTWIFTNVGSNSFKIRPSYSSTLVMEGSGFGTVNGTNVDLWTDIGQSNEAWTVVSVPNGFVLQPVYDRSMVLNDYGAGTTNGANVDLWSWTNTGADSASIWLLQ